MATLGEYIGAGSGTTKLLLHLNGNSTDTSGNSNNGTDSNITYSLSNGKFGQGAGLNNASNSKILFGSNVIITTISFWVNLIAIANNTIFLSLSPSNTIQGQATTGKILLYDGADRVSNFSWVTGSWQMYTFVYDTNGGNGYNIYNNGKFLEKITCNQLQMIQIGRDSPSGFCFTGNIDEVIVENRAWTAAQVAKYYSFSKGRFGTL